MCGQGGLAGTVTVFGETAFQRLLVYNSTRGVDSTGAASVKRDTEKDGRPLVFVAKELGNPYNLFDVRRNKETDFGDIVANQQRALLGHCRAKTIGGASRKNAHPFYHDNVVGTHNGTLTSWTHKKLLGSSKMDTDSEAVFYDISQTNIGETVKKFSEKDDAYALVWYDLRDNTINFLRNEKRPLWFAFSTDRQMIMWSSERGHLIAAMEGIPHEVNYLTELPVDDHYSWALPKTNEAFGKGHVVKRAQVIIPFTYTPHKKNWMTSGGMDTDNVIGFTDYERYDKHIKMYRRYNHLTKKDEFAGTWEGPYYHSIQECWDSMTAFQRETRIAYGEVPQGVTLQETDYEVKDAEFSLIDPQNDKTVIITPPPSSKEATKKTTEEAKERMKNRWLAEVLDNAIYPLIHYDENRRVYWNVKDKKYILCLFTGFKQGDRWKVATLKQCPSFVPCKKLDVDANHAFIHEGKKKNKRISYKGFSGLLLSQPLFETLMSEGCIECSRQPQWGNGVTFINKTSFLCEFCSRDIEKIRAVREAAKV